jgi:hypothetical protein
VHKERHVKRQRRLLQYTKLGHLQVAVVAVHTDVVGQEVPQQGPTSWTRHGRLVPS